MKNPIKNLRSRYGDERKVTDNGHGLYTIEGKSLYGRVGMTNDNMEIEYFDPEGGPFICVGSDYGFGTIRSIIVEESGKKNYFKIRVEVDDSIVADANDNNEKFRTTNMK